MKATYRMKIVSKRDYALITKQPVKRNWNGINLFLAPILLCSLCKANKYNVVMAYSLIRLFVHK